MLAQIVIVGLDLRAVLLREEVHPRHVALLARKGRHGPHLRFGRKPCGVDRVGELTHQQVVTQRFAVGQRSHADTRENDAEAVRVEATVYKKVGIAEYLSVERGLRRAKTCAACGLEEKRPLDHAVKYLRTKRILVKKGRIR